MTQIDTDKFNSSKRAGELRMPLLNICDHLCHLWIDFFVAGLASRLSPAAAEEHQDRPFCDVCFRVPSHTSLPPI
jgi:hypothetical protein